MRFVKMIKPIHPKPPVKWYQQLRTGDVVYHIDRGYMIVTQSAGFDSEIAFNLTILSTGETYGSYGPIDGLINDAVSGFFRPVEAGTELTFTVNSREVDDE